MISCLKLLIFIISVSFDDSVNNSTLDVIIIIFIFMYTLHCTGTCPVLCSGNGEYRDGACNCFPGWKGVECSIRYRVCLCFKCLLWDQCVLDCFVLN